MGQKGNCSEAQKRHGHKLDLSEIETPGQPLFIENDLSETQMQVNEVPCAAHKGRERSQNGISYVKVLHSQGDARYGCNRNRQCSCNSLTFLTALYDKNAKQR